MKTEELEQGSAEWLVARLGRATASRFGDVLAEIRTGEAAKRRNYKAELVIERLTGVAVERYRSSQMTFGSETESLARLTYALKTGNRPQETGFFTHKKLMAGASPDGLVGTEGLIEIKCRQIANHIDVLKKQHVLPEYLPQIQGQLWITDRKWCDFVSFAPELPKNAQLFVERVYRDEPFISRLAESVETFLREVDADIAFLTNYNEPIIKNVKLEEVGQLEYS